MLQETPCSQSTLKSNSAKKLSVEGHIANCPSKTHENTTEPPPGPLVKLCYYNPKVSLTLYTGIFENAASNASRAIGKSS